MTFWKPAKDKKPEPRLPDTGQAIPAKKKHKHSSPVSFEAKYLAIEAILAGADRRDVCEILGVKPNTISNWLKRYREDGVGGLCRKPANKTIRKQCTELEKCIVAHRKEYPEHGVRRIRDELRSKEGLAVSAEKVRQTVNAAGLGNPPLKPHKRPAQVRRFERPVPNAMWQIDIFTFQLKRMYKVYLVGIIDDHSRYMTGWGLYRQQTAASVMEVVKGAIGQWGAPREILSDNGRQFAAWRGKTKFQKVLKQQGIQHVRSAPHHPMTLGKIERFWQTIWREFLEEAVFASFADACQRLDHWVAYYNHQRPHQGINGACPADRFYGIAEDKDMAISQGCQENSLRLALGQEPKPPLYLLGQLVETDVRVMRKGDDIEIKVGDAVHEVIHLATPYEIQEDGHVFRESEPTEVEGSGRTAEVRSRRSGAQTGGVGDPVVPDVRHQSPDFVPRDGDSGQGRDSRFESEAEGSATDIEDRTGDPDPASSEQGANSESETTEAEEYDSARDAGVTPEGRPRAETRQRKKKVPETEVRAHEWI